MQGDCGRVYGAGRAKEKTVQLTSQLQTTITFDCMGVYSISNRSSF